MSKHSLKISAAALALAVGVGGAAQAEPLNIYTASQQDAKLELVRHGGHGYRYGHRYHNGGAAFALGTIGAIAGAAAYSSRYYDDYYYRRPYYGRRYYVEEPRTYYEDGDYCDNSYRPKHYPAPQGC